MLEPVLGVAAQCAGRMAEGGVDLMTDENLVAPNVPFPNRGTRRLKRHRAHLQLASILAVDVLAAMKGVLGDGKTEQRDDQHQTGIERGDDDVAGKLAKDSDGRAEYPD